MPRWYHAGGDGGRPGEPAGLDRGFAVGGGVVAELAVVVVAPGPHGAVGLDRHAVEQAGRHAGHAGETGHLDGDVAVGEGVVAELAPVVSAPAHTVPSALTARLWSSPPAMAVIPVRPLTCTGMRLWVVELFPRSPLRLSPQAHTVPSALRARLWL